MTKAIPETVILMLACLFVLSAALPSAPSQCMSTQTKPSVPRTLLGKPYRTRRDLQGCLRSRWNLAVTDRNDSDVSAVANPDYSSPHEAQVRNSGWTWSKMNTIPRIPMPLPLALNTFPESGLARSRFMKSRRPIQYSPCSDDAPPPEKTRPDGVNTRHEDEQCMHCRAASRPERKQGSHDVSVPVRHSKRLYNRGEWKSRLLEEY